MAQRYVNGITLPLMRKQENRNTVICGPSLSESFDFRIACVDET